MARLRINRWLNLTLDASTTDFIVKSLSGANDADLLLNALNYGVEIRIDENNTNDNAFKITKGSGGSTKLLTVKSDGFVGINNNAPGYRLVVDESTKNIAVHIRKTNNGDGGGILSGPTLFVENSYGNHSWGNLAEFRVGEDGGANPPHITFTAGWASTGWAVGMAGYNDADFGIVSNRGWRFGSLGTLQLRVKPDGQLITRGTITPGISSGFAGHINSSEPIKFVNGSAAQEIYVRKIRASTLWATNDANDPGDGGGFFSGNLIVNGTITGTLNGNSSTASKLQTARNISLGGSLSGSTSFDGSANVSINASINAGAVGNTQLADGAVTTQKIADGAVTAPKLAPGVATRKFQTTIGDGTNSTYTVTHNLDTTDIEVSLILLSTNEKIGAKVEVLNSNQAKVSFIAPIATNSVKVVVIG